jgi:hypothetical protein
MMGMLKVILHGVEPYLAETQTFSCRTKDIMSVTFAESSFDLLITGPKEVSFPSTMMGLDRFLEMWYNGQSNDTDFVLEATEASYKKTTEVRMALTERQKEKMEAAQKRVIPVGTELIDPRFRKN